MKLLVSHSWDRLETTYAFVVDDKVLADFYSPATKRLIEEEFVGRPMHQALLVLIGLESWLHFLAAEVAVEVARDVLLLETGGEE